MCMPGVFLAKQDMYWGLGKGVTWEILQKIKIYADLAFLLIKLLSTKISCSYIQQYISYEAFYHSM